MNPLRNFKIVRKPELTEVEESERKRLMTLASRVQDEKHWQDVLDGCATEVQREELERVLGPMLRFRRGAPCTSPGCSSGKHGIWQPVLVVRSPVDIESPSWVPIELRLCDDCKAEADVADFLTDSIWAQILTQWEKELPPPVRLLSQLKFDRVH